MDVRLLGTVFVTVFLAELGDKTQLSTMLYASGSAHQKWIVFAGSALALVASSALATFVGSLLGERLNPRLVSRLAGVAFLAVGAWTLYKA